MTKIFSSAEFIVNFDSIIINSSSQRRYYICFECAVQFSLTSRLLVHVKKNCFKIFTCKHCEKIMTSNNKFHEHVRLHYNKLFKTLKQRFVEKKNNHINLSISRFIFSITSMNSIAFKSSRRHEFTDMFFSIFSITFKSMFASTKSSFLIIFMTKTFVVCFFTFSLNSSQTSTLKH